MKIFDFRFLTDLHGLEYAEHDLIVFTKCLSVGLCVTQILWSRYRKNQGAELHKILYLVAC